MSIIERVKKLQLPQGEYVVIGSGLLDALKLREAHDLDIVASDSLFQMLRNSGEYEIKEKYGKELLESDAVEIWTDWKDDAPFETLLQAAIQVEGVTFASPDVIIKRKKERGTPKDIADIQLLETYLRDKII